MQNTKNTPKHKKSIVILGGYGNVGEHLSTFLASELDAPLIIAGRNGARAVQFAETLGAKASGLVIDITNPASYAQLFDPAHNVGVVVSCIELPDTSTLPKELFEHGIHFTELSAQYSAHERLMHLHEIAKHNSAASVIGVGLMPGLSNVLARDVITKHGPANELSINIMLGLGEAHGADSINWTLRQLGEKYTIEHHGGPENVVNFRGAHKTKLPNERLRRSFYHFNFSDQHMLAKSLPAQRVSSYMAFDSRFITRLLAISEKLGLLSLLKRLGPNVLYKIISSSTIGSSRYAVRVEARHADGAVVAMTAYGSIEAIATAAVAAFVAKLLWEQEIPAGSHPIEEIVAPEALYAYLRNKGIHIIEN